VAKKDGDLRMLGAVDGFAHVLVDLKFAIGRITHDFVNPRHVRKVRARKAILRPLLDLQAKYQNLHTETRAAYQRTTEPE
jgi:hypothetical protein